MAACSTNDCSCNGFETAEFPQQHYDKTLPAGGQLRITESGLGFLQGQVPQLISQFQPGGLSFCLPPQDGTAKLCQGETCTDGSPGCQLDLEIDDAQITPQPTDTLKVNIIIGGIGGQDASGNWQDLITVGAIGATCELHIWNKDNNKRNPAQVSARLPVKFSVDSDSPTRDVRIDIGDIEMDDFTDQVKYEVKGSGGIWDTIACGGANLIKGLLNSTINSQIKDQLGSALDGITNDQLCRACGDGEPACPGNSTCGDNGGAQSCMYSSGQCVPRTLGMEGKLMLGQLIGDYSQNPTSEVDILAKLADLAKVDTGLNLGLRIGAQPDEFGRCVPVDPTVRPGFDAIPPSPQLLGNTTPAGNPFMLGIGVHKRALEHIFWSIWGGGALCMKIDSTQVSQLSTTTLGALMPSITALAGNDAVAFLQLAPQGAPKVELGANTVTPSGDTYAITDALIHLNWDDVDLHFYVYAQERYVRVFTLRVDIKLPVALASDGQGSIIPVLGDMENAVQNIRPIKIELLKEDPQVLIDMIPTLIGMALPSLAGSISQPIDLPEVFGYRISLDQNDITSIDDKSMIALFADLVPVAQPMGFALQTRVLDARVDLSQWTAAGVPRPVAILDVVNDLPDFVNPAAAEDIEYSWRVDGGIWSMFERTDQLRIQDPMLVLQGRHRIEVRARFRNDPSTTERVPVTIHVPVDYAAPYLEVELDRNILNLRAIDAVDAPQEMVYRWRIIDGQAGAQWSAWSHDFALDLMALDAPEHFRLVAQVRDAAGFVAEVDQNIVWQRDIALDEAPGASNDAQASGCSAAGEQSPVGMLAAFFALITGLLLMRRRRAAAHSGARATSLLLVALVGLLGLTGCDDDPAGRTNLVETCDPECADNQTCVAGVCQDDEVPSVCSNDASCANQTCPTGEVPTCNADGTCGCVTACQAGCGDDQFCCFGTNSCQSIPDACADRLCDPGFEPSVVSAGTPDSQTCEVSGQACECVPLPPLTLGVYGHYAALAENGDVRAASVYNKTYTDLMVATIDASNKPTWYFVDGVPATGTIKGALDGPRGGISDRGANVGTHTAIGVDAQKNLHILYRDEDNKALKYARGTRSGTSYTFATTTLNDEGDAGYYASLLIAGDTLHAVYTVDNFNDPDHGWQSQLRYINFPVDAAVDQLAPQAEVVTASATADPCGGSCVGTEACRTGATPACEIPTRDCGSCGDGLGCFAGTCEPIYVKQSRSYPRMTGVFSQLGSTADGLIVTFFDDARHQVGWAKRVGDDWQAPEYLGEPSGPYVSGAVDADGKLHLAYMDRTEQALIYEQPGNGVREVILSGARDTTDGYVLADIGEDVDLKVAADGSITVVYQDATWHKFLLSKRAAAGGWTHQTLAEPATPYTGAHGFFGAMIRTPQGSGLAVEANLNQQADPTVGAPTFYTLP